jgi:ArsR family transcriptional regulator, arsenate/arsenite/antimonite-responsive transcriptional repressor
MKQFLSITKALADETRLRALLSLKGGELCLCQIIVVLKLAPSTVSKHMDILYQAGLVERRKEGRWHYFKLACCDVTPEAKEAIAWVMKSLKEKKVVVADAKQLCCVKEMGLTEVSSCYRES